MLKQMRMGGPVAAALLTVFSGDVMAHGGHGADPGLWHALISGGYHGEGGVGGVVGLALALGVAGWLGYRALRRHQ